MGSVRILALSALLSCTALVAPATGETWIFDLRGYQILGCQPLVTRGGFRFQLQDSSFCGACDPIVSSGGAPLVPGRLHGQVDEDETTWTGIEVDLVESDPALSATLAFLGTDGELGRVSVSATGTSTLALDRNGADVRSIVVDCCDCLVEELRIPDARVVGTDARALSMLKARYR